MRITLCGEPGAPLICSGREYGSYEIDEDTSEDERPLAETSKPQQPIISEEDQTLYRSEWKPYKMTNLETSKIKTWLNDRSRPAHDNETYITPHPLEILQHMLQKVQELHSDRYDDYLNSHSRDEIMSSMVALLRPKAWEVLCSRDYTREK